MSKWPDHSPLKVMTGRTWNYDTSPSHTLNQLLKIYPQMMCEVLCYWSPPNPIELITFRLHAPHNNIPLQFKFVYSKMHEHWCVHAYLVGRIVVISLNLSIIKLCTRTQFKWGHHPYWIQGRKSEVKVRGIICDLLQCQKMSRLWVDAPNIAADIGFFLYSWNAPSPTLFLSRSSLFILHTSFWSHIICI